jgi:hypothetical protein
MLPIGWIVNAKYIDNQIRAEGRRNHQQSDNSLQMNDEVLRSVMQKQLIELSMQDFAVITELAGVYDNDCIYQLLVAKLRQRIRVQFGK